MKRKNAISLIVLVITILVMAILAATIIITLSNTNIISQAKDAVEKTESQQIEEAKTIMLADGMMGNKPEPITIGDITLTWNESEKRVIVVETKNTEKYGVIIPEGFGYVEGTKDTGLVIEDKEGNQFVWVPVEYTLTEGETPDSKTGLYTSFINIFRKGDRPQYYEPYEIDELEYDSMRLSVQKYHGFYIARFESGDGNSSTQRNIATSLKDNEKIVSKKGAIVYNYVPWGQDYKTIKPGNITYYDLSLKKYITVTNVPGAVYLAKNMYKDSKSVVSTLCYGVQWDATMNFVSSESHNIKNMKSWGNYDGVIQVCGNSETWKAKNIYDLSGNICEWTMEGGETYDYDENQVMTTYYNRVFMGRSIQ